jgi:hypothetical protein
VFKKSRRLAEDIFHRALGAGRVTRDDCLGNGGMVLQVKRERTDRMKLWREGAEVMSV